MMEERLIAALVNLERDAALETVKASAKAGDNPLDLFRACQESMSIVGQRFEAGEYFLSELIIAAEIFKQVEGILVPYLEAARLPTPVGKIVLATLRGDIHDLGKNIFSTLARAQGFEIHDLGVDVQPTTVVEAVKELDPQFVGFSCLLSTAFRAMRETTEALEEAGLRNGRKVLLGGGVTTPELANYIGADFQTTDAAAGVSYCVRMVGGRGDES
jgi:methanogenic corrinoid protein MtbC1